MVFHRSSIGLPSVIPSVLRRSFNGLPTVFRRVCVPPPITPMAKALALEGGASLSKEANRRISTMRYGKTCFKPRSTRARLAAD
jgi:hypothetical protein